ncbi:protein NETWORKED 3A-like isoform X2 [Diospyros lotus]|uniref:protein NETWORKED 3A-like isoform X2 n=2 Tax=Diospyros lotus TaxID=55363 RepID=UPI0022520DBE|nr:protein NETWORKED 3A-like isoform X2 [Diospyros lotus]
MERQSLKVSGGMETKKTEASSHWWWLDNLSATSPTTPKRSPWLQSTLSELDVKTEAMLRIIEADAESFAQRAEMYYRKRPELISIVEQFYRAHRSLAEGYDQLKSDAGFRLTAPWASPLSFKYGVEKLMTCTEKSYDSFSETYDPMESGESEVDDPEPEEDPVNKEMEKEEVSSVLVKCEVMKLTEQIERLKEESKSQKKQIEEKDEEKRERIRQPTEVSREAVNEMVKLSEEIERLKEENMIQKKQLEEKDELKGKIIGQLKKVSSTVASDEMVKLREKIERLKEENKIQSDKLAEKEEEKGKIIEQLKEVSSTVVSDEMVKLREEIEMLKEENKIQNDKLAEKDEEKREVIRQLSLAMDMLREENLKLRKCIAKESPKKSSPSELRKLKLMFLGKLFNGSPKSQP